MVMADRPGVATASLPVTALTLVGLGEGILNGLARVPFAHPWRGPGGLLDNVGQSVTQHVLRSFMGYSTGLPIDEFRSMEKVLDQICRLVMPPFVGMLDDVELAEDQIGSVPGLWCRSRTSTDEYLDEGEDRETIKGTIMYLHGGGFIGTSPIMYAAFASSIVRLTKCEVFIADYRMAPEFPFPAGVEDAAEVYQGLLDRGVDPKHLVLAGDSGGGGLATSLVSHLHDNDLPRPAAMALFSPEVDLDFAHPSMTQNASLDILPWNVPVAPYLHGVQPNDHRVSAVHGEPQPEWFPPTFVCWGADEMFRDGVREFAKALAKGGVELEAQEKRGMFHVFPIVMPWLEPSKDVFRSLRAFVESHVAPDPKAVPTH